METTNQTTKIIKRFVIYGENRQESEEIKDKIVEYYKKKYDTPGVDVEGGYESTNKYGEIGQWMTFWIFPKEIYEEKN